MYYRDEHSGVVTQHSIAEGIMCTECVESIDIGMSYLPIDQAVAAAATDPIFAAKVKEGSDVRLGRIAETWSMPEEVMQDDAVHSNFELLLDGWTSESFAHAHNGVTPEEVDLQPVVETHPLSQQPVNVFYTVCSGPPFRRTIGSHVSTVRRTQRMPTRIKCPRPWGRSSSQCADGSGVPNQCAEYSQTPKCSCGNTALRHTTNGAII